MPVGDRRGHAPAVRRPAPARCADRRPRSRRSRDPRSAAVRRAGRAYTAVAAARSETGCSTVLIPWVEESVMITPELVGLVEHVSLGANRKPECPGRRFRRRLYVCHRAEPVRDSAPPGPTPGWSHARSCRGARVLSSAAGAPQIVGESRSIGARNPAPPGHTCWSAGPSGPDASIVLSAGSLRMNQ